MNKVLFIVFIITTSLQPTPKKKCDCSALIKIIYKDKFKAMESVECKSHINIKMGDTRTINLSSGIKVKYDEIIIETE